jgi:hypothetical protein
MLFSLCAHFYGCGICARAFIPSASLRACKSYTFDVRYQMLKSGTMLLKLAGGGGRQACPSSSELIALLGDVAYSVTSYN